MSHPVRNSLSRDGAATAPETSVTIVVPCFNEETTVTYLAERLSQLTANLGKDYSLDFVFVDDGSSDATEEALKKQFADEPGCRIFAHRENRGLAAAIMTGIREARTEIVCSIDADCTYDPLQLADLIPLLVDGVDMVTASPYHPRGRVCNVPRWRIGISKAAALLYRQCVRPPLYCYTSCFRVYRRNALMGIALENDGFVGISEMIWQLSRRGLTVIESPAVLDVRKYGQSKLRVGATVVGHLRFLLHVIRKRHRKPAGSEMSPQLKTHPDSQR